MLSRDKRIQIQDMLAEGLSGRKIAGMMGVSHYTVEMIRGELDDCGDTKNRRNHRIANDDANQVIHHIPQYHTNPDGMTRDDAVELFHIVEDVISLSESKIISHPLLDSLASDAERIVTTVRNRKR